MNTKAPIAFLLFTIAATAQTNISVLQQKESEMTRLAYRIINDTTEFGRTDAVIRFIPALVEALKIRGSFDYPFDSIKPYISILTPADKTFRIFTWQLSRDNGTHRYYGAIQKNNPDRLELYPLFDYTDSLLASESVDLNNVVLDNKHWKGAVYYNIIEKKVKKNTIYFLFGWDGHDLWSNKKIIDPLYFDEQGYPLFGVPLFELSEDRIQHRFILEYREEASVSLNYVPEEKMIIFDYLIAPEQRLSDLQFTFIPDGTYSGFKWKKNKWKLIEKLKVKSIGDFDNPPVPKPVDFEKEKKQMLKK
jgi:hypothetical protein